MPKFSGDPDGFFLSERDVSILRSVIDQEMQRRANTTSRLAVGDAIPTAPEVYVVFTPTDGIPGMSTVGEISGDPLGTGTVTTGTGTGPIGEGDIPGYADCDIYRVIHSFGSPQLVPLPGQRKVHNLSIAAVPGDSWILVARDKSGTWWVCGATGEEVWTIDCVEPVFSDVDDIDAVDIVGVVPPLHGGTGTDDTPIDGAVLIGSGGIYTSGVLTAGGQVTVTLGPGTVSIGTAGFTGTVP